MPAIGTTAIITAKPEAVAAVESALAELAEATQAEPGCIMWSLNRGLQEPNVFITVEKWESPEALEQHLGSAHIAAAMGRTAELLVEPPRIIATEPLPVGDPAKNVY
jgi:quinol monooxygenase YgiN